MDNSHSSGLHSCPDCGQSAWRLQGGRVSCIPCSYRPPISHGMGSSYNSIKTPDPADTPSEDFDPSSEDIPYGS